jgi:very-short-patch-repair endonuclease
MHVDGAHGRVRASQPAPQDATHVDGAHGRVRASQPAPQDAMHVDGAPGRVRASQPAPQDAMHVDGAPGRVRASQPTPGDATHVDRALGTIASGQQAMLARDQLLEAGLTPTAVDHWVRRGRLSPRHRGVYSLAHDAVPAHGEERAAVLACGDRALIGYWSAARMWGILPEADAGVIDVIAVGRHIRSRPGIRVHCVRKLMRCDVCELDGIALTSPARTIFDLAAILDERETELALHEAIARKLVAIADVRAVLERYPRRPGSVLLRTLVDPGRRLSGTESGGEERLLQAIIRSGLPRPHTRHRVGAWILDFYWPEARLGAELDGHDFHSTRPRLERDHLKDQDLRAAHGVLVLRFTGRQVARRLEYVLVTIAREYERRLHARPDAA